MEFLTQTLLYLFITFAVALAMMGVYYVVRGRKTTTSNPDKINPIHEKFHILAEKSNTSNPDGLSLKNILLEQIRDGTVDWETADPRAKGGIEIEGVRFKFIRNKPSQTNETAEPSLNYDESKDPDRIVKKKPEEIQDGEK